MSKSSSSSAVITRGVGRGFRRALKVLLLGEGDATHSTTALYTSLAPVLARKGSRSRTPRARPKC